MQITETIIKHQGKTKKEAFEIALKSLDGIESFASSLKDKKTNETSQ